MRNGFSVSSSSEFVNEIRDDAREALFHYHATACFRPGRGLRAWTRPAILGRIKSARRFALDLADGWQDHPADPQPQEHTPLDLALAAVGVCSLKTAIAGGSARGITFDSIEMVVSAEVQPQEEDFLPTARVRRIAYDITTRSDADAGLIEEVTRQILDRSPNHRTVKDTTELHFHAGERELGWSPAAIPAGASGGRTVRRHVKWISGTQFESAGLDADGCRLPLRVDEAKQFAGVDWAPNPQEYVVLALAAELASLAAREQEAATGSAGTWSVHAHGLLDLRGLMLVDPAAAVGFQTIGCTVDRPAGLGADEADRYFRTAVERSALVELLALPHPVEVRLSSDEREALRAAAGR
ncbi:OsmC family protein [Streptomyces sp. P10-4]|uniref:OsmC family protein n=1 Tax=Streptomyces sp. P10-4 TaxID=3421645 RepID=UPI003D265341